MKNSLTVSYMKQALGQIKKYFPNQGPLEVFVHHNTLHEFENLNFHEAVTHLKAVKGAKAYMPHEKYLEAYESNRISDRDLESQMTNDIYILLNNLNEILNPFNKFDLFKFMLFSDNTSYDLKSLNWILWNNSDEFMIHKNLMDSYVKALDKKYLSNIDEKIHNRLMQYEQISDFISLEEYEECRLREKKSNWLKRVLLIDLFKQIEIASNKIKKTNSSQSVASLSIDNECILLMNKNIYEYLTSYFDKGIAFWHIDKHHLGLLATYIELYVKSDFRFKGIQKGYLLNERTDPYDLLITLLPDNLNIDELQPFLMSLLKDIQGWWGVVYHGSPEPDKDFCELVLIRLIQFTAFHGKVIRKNRDNSGKSDSITKNVQIMKLFLNLGKHGLDIESMSQNQFKYFYDLINFFDENKKCKILHLSYENSYYSKVIHAIEYNHARNFSSGETSFDAIFCIDDREESLRRHLEEVDKNCKTYGYAGFFNVDIFYRYLNRLNDVSLCPLSIKPEKIIKEEQKHKKTFSNVLERVRSSIHQESRSLVSGTFLHLSLMSFTVLSDLIRLVFPKLYANMVSSLSNSLKNFEENISQVLTEHGDDYSFGFVEACDRVEALLKTIGKKDFADIVFVIGHGSSSLNNPHKSAYDCGACSGQKGAPNARIFCRFANDKDIRNLLKKRHVFIPEQCVFVGGYHDTASDDIIFYDLDRVPVSHREKLDKYRKVFDQARALDAQERARRFMSIPFVEPKRALAEVKARAMKYAQPRPEYCHATNALCILGDREMTKNIFLDRRAFLCSYDSKQDPNGTILAALLGSVVPVCAGINLEYYFSYVDNEIYGAGSKLPHNVSGLVGVMSGAQSDLRTGLSWQMVEIHEPMRLMFVIQANKGILEKAKKIIPHVFQFIENGWVNLSLCDPDTGKIEFISKDFRKNKGYSVPHALTSNQYYYGRREHLNPCLIGAI